MNTGAEGAGSVSEELTTLGALLRSRAALDPDAEFLVAGDRRLTYADVERASRLFAADLIEAGVGKATRVGIYQTVSPEWVVSWLAATRIGAVVIPLSTHYRPRELGIAIRNSDVDTLIYSPKILSRNGNEILEDALPDLRGSVGPVLALGQAPYLRRALAVGPGAAPWSMPVDVLSSDARNGELVHLVDLLERGVHASDLAIVVYTSGSSAEPKGVVHTHRSVLTSAASMPALYATRSGGSPPRVFCGMPFFWVGGVLELVGALLEPATLILMERIEPSGALAVIEREHVTVVLGWPSLIQSLRAHPDFVRRDLASAHDLVHGPADPALVGSPLPGIPRHRGMSESMGTFTGVDVAVVDHGSNQPLPAGVEGELLIRGPGLMAGYYGKTREDVFDADGWYRTGDKVVMVPGDSRPYYLGRFSEMIKSAGANVAPREVESVLEEVEGVTHCFVLGIPHVLRGEEVVAIVVPLSGQDSTKLIERAAEHAKAGLSSYKVPTRWIVMSAEDVPWLGSGKPDKQGIRNLHGLQKAGSAS